VLSRPKSDLLFWTGRIDVRQLLAVICDMLLTWLSMFLASNRKPGMSGEVVLSVSIVYMWGLGLGLVLVLHYSSLQHMWFRVHTYYVLVVDSVTATS